MNVLGDIFNDSGNVEDQEDYGFTESFFKIAPTVIDNITKNKLINMHLEKSRYQRYIENIDKESDGRNWVDVIEDKESDERNQIGENDEDRSTDDI